MYGSVNAGERDGWGIFRDKAEPQVSYYLFANRCNGEFTVFEDGKVSTITTDLSDYEDAIEEIERGYLPHWDFEISDGLRQAWDFKFEMDNYEDVVVNGYKMRKYNGKIVYQTDELNESKNEVQEKCMTLYVTKAEEQYIFFMMVGHGEVNEEHARVVEYFADKSAQTFCVK